MTAELCRAVGNRTSEDTAVTDRRYNRWLARFAWFTAAATLLLICSGGMVTSKGVGLAVPDWPTTFGYNMFFFPVSKWVGGIFFEHTHRLIASLVGFLSIILAFWLAFSKVERWIKVLGWVSLGAVVLQGILGGLRVTLLKDQIGIFHACLAQAFLGMLVVIALATSPVWRRLSRSAGAVLRQSLLILALAASALIYGQLALGATMRHQHRDLSIMDFPLAYGQIIPATDPAAIARINRARDAQALSDVSAGQIWLQLVHRFLAAIIGLTIAAFWLFVRREKMAIPFLRGLSNLWLGLVILQITLGAWTVLSNKAADIATAHVAVGAVTFATGIVISATLFRLRRATEVSLTGGRTRLFAEAGTR
jgi:heme a synthase